MTGVYTNADRKDIAKELKAPNVGLVAVYRAPDVGEGNRALAGQCTSHTLTGTFGPGDEYDPSRDPKEVAREAARITGEEIARAFSNQKGA